MTARATAWCLATATVAVGASIALSAQGAPRLSLKEAEQQALKNHPQILAAQDLAGAAGEAAREARAAFLPSVSASVTGANAEAGTRIAAGAFNNPTILERFATGFAVGQLVTDFGRTRDLVRSLDLRADAQREDVDGRRADVLLQVDRAYFNALRAKAVLNVAQQTVDARQLVVDQVSALAASNLKSGLDVSLVRVNLGDAQLLLVQAENDVQAGYGSLAAAMGTSDAGPYDLADEPLPPPPAADPLPLIEQALHERPDVLAERLAEQAAAGFAVAEGELWRPAVSAAAAAGVVPYHQIGLNDHYAAAAVNVTVPVFTGGLLAARATEASLRARAESERRQDLETRVARDVRSAWLDARTAFQRLSLTDQILAEASDAADLAQSRYDIGLSSVVELSQAQLAKTRASLEVAAARYEYATRTSILRFQIGELK